ncbi:AraC family transcriptional regulator [Roseitalea sp. MMSF_3504]|uniref:helix-turn-helix transcriptional regulator n=1 Tax=Roseitalea sp. MMSF_3504 TaxID=3046716 RepID=UPI00273E789C|nr:AraC family transcriptional regulator [Roseitalea sp. MMSF_3504]
MIFFRPFLHLQKEGKGVRFPQKLFRIDTYLDRGEAFHFTRKPLPETPPILEHHHDYFELMLVEQGQVHHWINGVEEVLEPGHLVFLRPTDSHALQSVSGTGAGILNVVFRPETAEHLVKRYRDDVAGRFFWQSGPLPVALRLRGPQKERAVNAMLSLQTSHRSLARIEHFLLSVITHVLDAAEVVDDRAPAWLLNACRAVREPRVFRQGAEGFLAAAGRSQEHVCRQARRHLGLSPTQYVNRIRIQHAAMLLAGTDRGLPEVASDCGFENLSYFHRLFRDQYGTTPRNYRMRHRQSAPSEGPL